MTNDIKDDMPKAFLGLCFFANVVLFVFLALPLFGPVLDSTIDLAESLVAVVCSIWIGIISLKYFIKKRSQLSTLVHFCFWSYLGVCVYLALGVVTFLSYYFDPDGFEVKDSVKSEDLRYARRKLKESEVYVEESTALATTLRSSSLTSFERRPVYGFFFDQRQEVVTDIDDLRLELRYHDDSSETSVGQKILDQLVIVKDGHVKTLGLRKWLSYQSDFPSLEPSRKTVEKDSLVYELESSSAARFAKLPDLRRDAEKKPEDIRIAPSLFVYSSLMSALGSDPGYFEANGIGPRIIYFIAALVKYLYFGWFVSFAVSIRPSRSLTPEVE